MWMAYLITQTIEIPLFLFLNKRENWKQNLFAIVLTNTVTWPFATYLWNFSSVSLFSIEVAVVLAEAFIFSFIFGINLKKAILIAFIVNIVSTIFGFLINQYVGGKIF